MIGMPASTNTLSWREKCMISLRVTVFFVISNLRMLLCSFTSIGCSPRSITKSGAALIDAAFSVPLTLLPLWLKVRYSGNSLRSSSQSPYSHNA